MTAAEQPTSKVLIEQTQARGAYPHPLDGNRTVDKLSTMDAIAAALSFPPHFGRNLDALYDCLTDLSWLPSGEHVLIWVGSDRLKQAEPRTYQAIRRLLSDAQRVSGSAGDRADDRRLTVMLPDS